MFEDLNPLDKSTAMMEIVIMVAGAALIGFFIGWLIRKLQKDKLSADLRFLQNKHETLNRKADASVKDHNDLQRLVDDLRQRKDALFSEVEKYKKDIQILEEKTDKSGTSSDNSDELNALREQVTQLEQERTSMQQQLSELKVAPKSAEIAPLKDLIDALENEKRDLSAKLEAQANDKSGLEEIERLKASIASANEEKEQLRTKLKSQSESLPDPGELDLMQTRIDNLDSDNKALKDKLGSILSDEESKAKITDLKDQVSGLLRKNRELEEEKHELEEKLDEPAESTVDPKEIGDLKLQIASLESEKESLQNALKKRMSETIVPEQITILEQKMEELKRDLEPVIVKHENSHHDSHENNGEMGPDNDKEDNRSAAEEDKKESTPSKSEGKEVAERLDTTLTYEDYQAKKKSLISSVGKATEAEKDALSEIVGVGPFIEAKLNSIGIYTYEQIRRFSEEDTQNVTRLIEFFPGRIERDGWVRQATKLLKKKEQV